MLRLFTMQLVVGMAFSSAMAAAGELMTLKDYLKNAFVGTAKISKEDFSLKDEEKKTLASIAPDAQDGAFTFYYGRTSAGELQKACTVVPQKGKEGPMTVGVCFDPSGLISEVKVLSYEEEKGKPVAEEGFLKQFKGKKVSDSFQVGQDVDGVSGATYSSKSVSEAIRKSSYAFKTFIGVKK